MRHSRKMRLDALCEYLSGPSEWLYKILLQNVGKIFERGLDAVSVSPVLQYVPPSCEGVSPQELAVTFIETGTS